MRASLRLLVPSLAGLVTIAGLGACAAKVDSTGATAASQTVGVAVDPVAADLVPGQTTQFAAAVTGTADVTVVWSVDESGGGTVDQTGLYTAPQGAGSFHVRVTSQADSSRSAVATVTVTVPPAGTVSISPHTATIVAGGTQAFTASVVGISNPAVTWAVQEASGCGSISAAGSYTAPATAGTCHVVATSVSDPTRRDVATITVTPVPIVAVTISPKTTTTSAGGTVSFQARVTGTSNTAVTWSVQEGSGCGSVSSTGVYTTPGAAATCHVVATSAADRTKSDVATITITGPVTVTVAPATGTVDACRTLTFTASVSGTSSQSVTWSVQEGAAGGTVSSAGVYTAPSNAGTYHVVATSTAGGAPGSAVVTVQDHILAVSVQPATVTVGAGNSQQFTATVTTSCGAFTATQTLATP